MRFASSIARRFEAKDATQRSAYSGGQSNYRLTNKFDWTVDKAVSQGMEKVTWVFKAVHTIASNQAKLPIVMREEDRWNGAVREDHELLPLYNRKANPFEKSVGWRYRLSCLLLLSRDGVFVEVLRSRMGEVLGLYILPPGFTKPIKDPDTFVSGFEVVVPSQPRRVIEPENVLWFRSQHPTDPYRSLIPLEACGLAVESDWWAKLYNRNFMANDGRPAGIVVLKGGDMEDEDVKEIEARLHSRPGVSTKRISLVSSENGADWLDLNTSPKDAEWLSSISAGKQEISVAFGVPLTVMGDTSDRCVDDQTEALTQRGWLRGDELTTEDTILSMEPTTGRLTWSPVREVYRAPYDGPMYRLKNRHADFLVTPGHKWALDDGRLVEVEKLSTHDRIRSMGERECALEEPVYSSAFVELVGWAVTEGHYVPNSWTATHKPGTKAPHVRIRQKEGPNIERIERCLKECGARFIQRVDRDRPMYRFDVTGEIAAALQQVSPGRVMTPEFIGALTGEQREMLVQTMIDADGSRSKRTSSWVFGQKDRAASEAFVMLATLAGYSTSTRYYEWRTQTPMWVTIVRQRKVMTIQRETRTVEHYEGMVWCPRTDFGTFVARRNGRVVVTGNTYENADADKETFWGETMPFHLETVGQGFDDLDGDDALFCGFDVSGVEYLQKVRQAKEKHLLELLKDHAITVDEFREATGRDPLGGSAARLWRPINMVTVDDEVPPPVRLVAASRQLGVVLPGRVLEPPAPLALPAADARIRSSDADGKRAISGALSKEDAGPSEDTAVDFGAWKVSARRLNARRKERESKLIAWERTARISMEKFFARQARVVLEKLEGKKVREMWTEEKDGQLVLSKAKVPSPSAIFDRKVWDAQLKDDARAWVEGVVEDFGTDVVDTFQAKQVEVGFDVEDPEVVDLIEDRVNQVVGVNDTTYEHIKSAMAQGVEEGESIAQLSKRIQAVFGTSKTRAERIARTEVIGAANGGAMLGAKSTGMELEKVWLCVAGNTRVSGPDVRFVARRWHEGPIVELRTVSGRVLAVTPNHQVLTGRGWVAAEGVHEGDDLISSDVRLEGAAPEAGVVPDVDHVPPTIAEVFDTAADAAARSGTVRRVVNFDSEGGYSEVDVVPVDGELREHLQVAMSQRLRQFLLELSDVRLGALFAPCPAFQHVAAHGDADSLSGCRGRPNREHVVALSRRSDLPGGGLVSDRLVDEVEALPDSGTGAAVLLAEGGDREPASVVLGYDRCESVHIRSSGGHVYDYTTGTGWMVASSLIVHNSTADKRTRASHAAAGGQTVGMDEKFIVGGHEMEYPGDPAAPPDEVIMCRCTVLFAEVDGSLVL